MKKIINNQRVKVLEMYYANNATEIDKKINDWIEELNYKINILNISTASCGGSANNYIFIFIHYEIVK